MPNQTPVAALRAPELPPLTLASPRISVIVPVFNKVAHLARTLPALEAAVQRYGNAELLLVDHGSTDGSFEALPRYAPGARISQLRQGTVAAVRNEGARRASGAIFSFVDCDVLVPPDYLSAIVATFAESGAAAVGRRVGLPASPHWIERTWDTLHAREQDGFRNYINSGNFAVRREAFERVGGFDERLTTGEDTDICRRLNARGLGVYSARALSVGHLDNPKSLQAFFRREAWHGLGMGGGRPLRTPCKATVMTATHAALLVTALGGILPFEGAGLPLRIGFGALLMLLVPATTVAFRTRQTGRLTNLAAALALYEVYYLARAVALARILLRRAEGRPPASAEPAFALAAAQRPET